jgi:hypothetical protein
MASAGREAAGGGLEFQQDHVEVLLGLQRQAEQRCAGGQRSGVAQAAATLLDTTPPR